MKTLVQVIRKKRSGKRIGIIVAIGKGKVGWSKCSTLDDFDKNVGMAIAVTSIEHPDIFPDRKMPLDFVKFIDNMNRRSFKAKIFQ